MVTDGHDTRLAALCDAKVHRSLMQIQISPICW
jgi:hypothetical protein